MKNTDKKLLFNLLKQFFEENSVENSYLWLRNPIGIYIKKELQKRKRWKNFNRGKNIQDL